MALPSSIQTLTAAFSFGILLQAAAGALFLYFKGHGSKLFQDGRRLVLMLFLLFAALWAQLSFFNLMVTETSSSTCQALLVFTTIFDQLARVAVEQFFLWAMSEGTRATTQQLVLQATLAIRLIMGGILVGLTRPDFAPVCVAQTSVLPIAITVLALDIIIIGVLMVRAFSMGIFSNIKEGGKGNHREQSRALSFGLFAFAIWTGTSVPMILGIPTLELIVRTVVPSNGLLVLVGVVTIFPTALLSKREEEATTPEAHSPFMAPTPPTREIPREGVDNGSPVSGQNYAKNGGLFVVNPSAIPRDSPTSKFQSNFGGDTRGFTKLSEVSVNPVEDNGGFLGSKNGPGNRRSSGVLPSMFAAPLQAGVSISVAKDMLVAPGRSQTTPVPNLRTPIAQQKRGLFNWSKSPVKPSVRNLSISNPVMGTDQENVQPFAKVQTIDLATAAANERERREGAAARSRETINSPTQNPLAMATTSGLNRIISVKRKEPVRQSNEFLQGMPNSHFSAWGGTTASSSSTSLSPGHEEVRRRSPRNSKTFERSIDKPAPKPPLQRTGTIGLPSNPRSGSQRKTMGRKLILANEPTVMLVNEIVYDDPATVKTIMDTAPARPKTAGAVSEDVYSAGLKSSNSIIHRPRPIRRDSEKDRAIFPSQSPLHHKRSKSGPASAFRKSMLASQPGSPTDLPPLPPPPTKAVNLRRILPNDTKSMTFDEKIELLFPAPPGMPTIPNRRSSVPSIPRVPSTYVSDVRLLKSPDWVESRRSSKRTTIASFSFSEANERSLHTSQASKIPEKVADRATYRFSANTYRNIADEVGETWIPGIAPTSVDTRNTLQQSRKPTTYEERKSVWTESSQEDATSYWGSVHSEMHPVDLSAARKRARSTFVQLGKPDDSKTLPPVPPLDYNDQEEAITVMLDSEETGQPILSEPTADRDSSVLGNQPSTWTKLPASQVLPSWHRRIGDELPTFSERSSNVKARKLPPPTPLLLNNSSRQAKVIVHTAEPSPIDSPERAIQEIQAQLKRLEDPNRGSVDSLIRNLPNMTSVEKDNASERFRLLENLEKEMGLQEDQWQQMHDNFDRDSISVMTPQASIHSESDLSRQSSMKSSRAPSRANSRRNRVQSGMTVRSKGDDTTSTVSTVSSDNSRASIWQQRLAEAQVEYLEKAPALLRKKSLNFFSLGNSHQILSPTPPESVNSETDQSDSEAEHGKVQPASQQFVSKLWEQAVQSPKAASGRMWNPPYESILSHAVHFEPTARDLRPAQRPLAATLSISSSNLWSKPHTLEGKRAVVGLWGSKPVRPTSIVTRRVTQRPQRKSKRVTYLPDIVESPVPLPNKRDTLGIYQFPWGEKSDTAVYQPVLNQTLELSSMVSAKLQARSEELEPDLDEYSQSYFDDYDEEEEDSSDMDVDSDDDFDETTLWEIANLLQSADVPSKNSLLPPARQLQWSDSFNKNDRKDEIEGMTSQEQEEETAVAHGPLMKLPIQPLSRTSRDSSLLWVDSTTSVEMANTGLPQPDASTWRSLAKTTSDPSRSGSRSIKGLPAIQSDSLWTAPIADTPRPDSAILWQSNSINTANGISAGAKPLMWLPQVKICDSRHSGLFVFQLGRPTIRSTNSAPAAANVCHNARPSNSTLSKLSSSTMWSSQVNQGMSVNWISASNSHSETSHIPATTWAPTAKVVCATPQGLFQVNESSSVCRTSNLQPAALNMTSKPRQELMNMSALMSNELWNGREPSLVERDWISESSVRPESPSVYSATSSGQSSPSSDASSVKSTSTKASSIWGSLRSVTPWSNKPAKKQSASPIEGPKSASRLPFRQLKKLPEEPVSDSRSSKLPAPIKTLVPLRESRVLSSGDIFDAKALSLDVAPIKKSQRVVVPVQLKPSVVKPLRHQHLSIVAFRADWEAALTEAIVAGAPKKISERVVTTPADWKAALDSAILASAPRLRRSKASQADWRAALNIAVLKSEPRLQRMNASSAAWSAALQKAISQSVGPKSVRYDASICHPVFFTNNLMTDASQIHPAAFGYCKKITKSFMWSSTTNARTLDSTRLWSAKVDAKQEQNIFSIADVQVIRRKNSPRSVELTTLETSALWHKASVKNPRQNWLISNKAKKTLAFTLPTSQPTKLIKRSFLWTKGNAKHSVEPSFDIVMKPITFKKSSSSMTDDLPVLASTTLWQSSSTMIVEHNWLFANDKIAARTWTPKAPVHPEVNSHLWSKDRVFDCHAPAQSRLHESIIARKIQSRNLGWLPILESSEFWKPLLVSTTERNWLMAPKKIVAQTWTPVSRPDSASSSKNDMLWSKQKVIGRNDIPQMKISPEQFTRKFASRESVRPPILESCKLWEQPASVLPKRQWMTVETRAKALTWSPRPSTPKVSNNSMWTAQDLTVQEDDTNIFAKITHEHIRKPAVSPKAPLPMLVSTELFQAQVDTKTAPKNWLHDTSKFLVSTSLPMTTFNKESSWTWTAPVLVASVNAEGVMWRVQPAINSATLALFSNPHSTPLKRNKRRLSTLESIESSEMWRRSTDIPTSPQNWLLKGKARSSKVEFRY